VTPSRLPADEVWTTVEETALLLKRSPQTIRNLVSVHELPRRIIKVGRAKRRVMILSQKTRDRLRDLCWGPQEGMKTRNTT
jgi:hypothetical protein